MPHISLKDKESSEVILLPDEQSLTEIAPDQTNEADFMMMNYEILADPEFDGTYRLIYGDIAVEFEIICDVAC